MISNPFFNFYTHLEMLKIAHRINTLEQLSEVPSSLGVEVDIRYHENRLILHHDPFHHHEGKGTDFDEYLKAYRHKFMILNIKTEGVEALCVEKMKEHGIEDYFLLDLSMPYFVKYAKYEPLDKKHLTVRFSEHEPLEYALEFIDCTDWLWVDCFKKLPLTADNFQLLKKHFKICLVSPELQGHPLEWIDEFASQVEGMGIDAVCTKRPDLWPDDLN